ncbi:hypothetical protein QBC43DRAFT_359811 [Cladorrhinum sp. PSN259]|nr:hypothetical protein QBC43DRAFT_359811 [Cladorrhinum sp. PSN259]
MLGIWACLRGLLPRDSCGPPANHNTNLKPEFATECCQSARNSVIQETWFLPPKKIGSPAEAAPPAFPNSCPQLFPAARIWAATSKLNPPPFSFAMYRDEDNMEPFEPDEDMILQARRASSRLHLMTKKKSYNIPWQHVPEYELPAIDQVPAWLPKIGYHSQKSKAKKRQQLKEQQGTEWKKPILPLSALRPKKQALPPIIIPPAPAAYTRVARLKQEDGLASHNLPAPPPGGQTGGVHTQREQGTWGFYAHVQPEQHPRGTTYPRQETGSRQENYVPADYQLQVSRMITVSGEWETVASTSYFQTQKSQEVAENWEPKTTAAPVYHQSFHPGHPQKPTRWTAVPVPIAAPPSRQPLIAFSGAPPPRQPSTSAVTHTSTLLASLTQKTSTKANKTCKATNPTRPRGTKRQASPSLARTETVNKITETGVADAETGGGGDARDELARMASSRPGSAAKRARTKK